ncbi:hypothetical protein [Spiroplasma endosymbiont of Tipula paludosa]|uniref:hypothetical protein n=1 Tax=Spiroplasma endosymbiont of Tipula paludosa TaxID=3066295 RepID=UPI0035C90971
MFRYCEENILIPALNCPFCSEHLTKYDDDFILRYKISKELLDVLKTNEEFKAEFAKDIIIDFIDEEMRNYIKKPHQFIWCGKIIAVISLFFLLIKIV